jgi:hypothetical protein
MRIAIVGSGVSGLGAAWAAARVHDVTLFEADDRPGGHAHTTHVADRGRSVAVDSGFIVYNPPTYPNLVAWFEALGVPTEPSDMSFAVSAAGGGFEYRARALGLLAQPSNLVSHAYRGMVADIVRFCREAPMATDDETVGAFLERRRFGPAFRDGFLLPMIACIWSSSLEAMLGYPMGTLARFLGNHGLLDLGRRPRWRTVTGGTHIYVERVTARLADLRLGMPVTAIDRRSDGVVVSTLAGSDTYDHVVFATHADTTLEVLGAGATDAERRILGAFRFRANRAVLHRDPTLMPRRRRVWSSWNFLSQGPLGAGGGTPVSLSYWMNRLQNLDTADPVIVTLNPHREPRGWSRSFTYHHPVFDRRAVDAQRDLGLVQGAARTWFAGAWTGYGFHEDGLRSGLAVAAALGAPAPWAGAPSTIDDLGPPGEPAGRPDPVSAP